MVEIELSIDPETVHALLEMVQNVVDSIGDHAVAPSYIPADDPDLKKAWEEDLKESLEADCAFLFQVFRDNRFGRGKFKLAEEAAEGLMRACSAIRLKLHETALPGITDSQLETGELDILDLPPEQQRFYACYLFLGGLQSMIISRLDPLCDEL